MKKFSIRRTLAASLLALTLTVGVGGGLAHAKTVWHNGVKLQYGDSICCWARSYLNEGSISPHWASVKIPKTGQYARRNQPYKGWTAKAKINPNTWSTYTYYVDGGKGW